MALKDDLIKQLSDISTLLGRTVSTEGSVEELKLRLREAQEELEALNDGEEGNEQSTAGDGSDSEQSAARTPTPAAEEGKAFVLVRVLRTLHVKGLEPRTRRPVRIVQQDSEVLVASADLPALKGLVREV